MSQKIRYLFLEINCENWFHKIRALSECNVQVHYPRVVTATSLREYILRKWLYWTTTKRYSIILHTHWFFYIYITAVHVTWVESIVWFLPGETKYANKPADLVLLKNALHLKNKQQYVWTNQNPYHFFARKVLNSFRRKIVAIYPILRKIGLRSVGFSNEWLATKL